MLRSAALIVLGISIGVVATLMLRHAPSSQSENSPGNSAPSSGVPASIFARDVSDASGEAELLDIIAEFEDIATDLNARLQESRRLVTYYEDRDFRQREAARQPPPDQVIEQLVASGLTQERAEWIIDRHNDLYRESLGAMFSLESYANSWEGLLRQELGDADFEAYLSARAEVPAVQVGTIVDTSSARLAGLRYGDHIRSYDGHRVFDIRELIPLTVQRRKDESVIIDILREGQPMQLIIPGGPLDAELSSGDLFAAPSFDPRELLSE